VDVLKGMEQAQPFELTTHVQTLLKALKSIVTFEAEMKTSFSIYSRGLEDEIKIDFTDSMTEAFDNFLGPYVQLEREELDKLMQKIMNDEDKGPLKPGEAFVSARKMFEFIKKSLKRCTGYSTGQTYLALSKEFRICLHNYAESLKFRCPSPEYTKPGKPLVYIVTPEIEEVLCRIVVTGEYCIDTVPQLEAMMKKHIQPSLADEINFSGQIDTLNDMVAFTLGILTQGIVQRIYPSFKTMREMNWTLVTGVGDESKYVKEAIAILNQAIPRIRASMSPSYFQSFCMKLVTATLDSLTNNIWKLKRIAQTGAGQLLLDLNGFKEYLLRMPNARLEVGKDPIVISNPYKAFVNSRIQQIQVILKLVCTDDDKMEEMFGLLWPEGTKAEYDAVVALKGKANILDPVGDKLKVHAEKLGQTVVGQKAMGEIKSGLGDIKSGLKSGLGGFKNAFGDIRAAFTGDLFDNGSHSHGSTHGTGSTHGNSTHGNSTHGYDNGVKKPATGNNIVGVAKPNTVNKPK
jgi:hypothetical protein